MNCELIDILADHCMFVITDQNGKCHSIQDFWTFK